MTVVACVLLFISLIVQTKLQDSYLRYYPPFFKADFSHYGAEVECYMGKGELYAGNQNYTNSGKPCVDWKQTEFRNQASCVYCRNPDSSSAGPWCYTDGLGERESCHTQIPRCGLVYNFEEGARVKLSHKWGRRNDSMMLVSFKPYIPENHTETVKYTLFSIPGHLNTGIRLFYNWHPNEGSYIQLEWVYHEDITPVWIRSRKEDHRFYNVKISRKHQNISMRVNNKVYESVGQLSPLEFEDTGNIEVGFSGGSPTSKFAGCMSNVQYNDIRVLNQIDRSESERPPLRATVSMTGNITKTDSCMYVAPLNFVRPAYSCTDKVHTSVCLQLVLGLFSGLLCCS
ncbi:hypothetical protein ACHWQZ_G004486 [Mnemiopsis leidyi]